MQGIYVDQIYDIGRIEDVQWNPWYVKVHCTCRYIGRCNQCGGIYMYMHTLECTTTCNLLCSVSVSHTCILECGGFGGLITPVCYIHVPSLSSPDAQVDFVVLLS